MFWEIAYYDGQLPLRYIDSDNNGLLDIEQQNVVWVKIKSPGKRPWGREGVEYELRMLGADVYLFDLKSPHLLYFGLENEDGTRQDFEWTPDHGFVHVADKSGGYGYSLYGVTVPDEDAREIGLMS